MSTFPVLNDRPIDHWMITELKDELQRRNLPVSGSKDVLVKRLFEAIQDEILDGGEKTSGGTPPAQELKEGETPGSVDASVYQALTEHNVDEGASEVTKQGADLVISVIEDYSKSIVVTSEVSQEAVNVTSEASQKTLDAVAEVESSLVDIASIIDKTNGIGLESASSGNTIVKEVNSHSESHGDTIEKTPEDDTNKKMDVDEVPSDGTGIDIKSVIDVHSKILEQVAEDTPPDDITLHADHEDANIVAVAEQEDDTSKKMVIDDVLSDITHSNVKLSVEVDCKTEQEEVPTLPDAIALHADPKDAGIVAAAESMIPKDNFSKNTLMYGKGHEDPECTNGDCKPILCGAKDQVSEVNPDIDSQIKCVSNFHDNISTNEKNDVKDNLNAHSSKLELEANQEMVKPSSTVPSLGDHLQVLDGDKELHTNETSLQQLGSTSNIDLVREEESPDGSSRERLNLDRSSSDESMDENMMKSKHANSNMKSDDFGGKTEVTPEHMLNEVSPDGSFREKLNLDKSSGDESMDKDVIKSKHADSNIKSDDLGGKTDVTSEHVLKEVSPDGSSHEKLNLDKSSSDESMDEDMVESKLADSNIKSDDIGGKTEVTSERVLEEVTLLDTVAEGSSALTKEVVAEEKSATPVQKRKLQDREVIANNKQIKRQHVWNVDTVNISDQQAFKLTGIGTPKEVLRSAQKCSFGRSDSTASGDSPKEWIPPPAKNPATTSLRIDRFVRPFTLKAVQELLGRTGSVCSFWMDRIKTHCYVTYSTVEEAVATRNAVYNLQWPPNNRNYLVAEFVDPQEVKLKLESPPPVPITPSTAIAPQSAPFQQSKVNPILPPDDAASSRGVLPTPALLAKPPPTSGPGPAWERLPPPPPRNLEPALTLDDLFKKTHAYPRIYYMPLSEEEASAKLAARDNDATIRRTNAKGIDGFSSHS